MPLMQPVFLRVCVAQGNHYMCGHAFSYEAYLDSQITSTDMFYLEDIHRARYLVELG